MAQESTGGAADAPSRTNEPPSIIAAGLRIIGNVASGGVVHIEGEVDGDIQCAELTIGAAGRVTGHVTAAAVLVLGSMAGTIRARQVHLGRGARVVGEVIHERLTVDAGAWLDGYYRPVEKVEMSAAVDVRRQIGRAPHGESLLPRRSLPPFRKRPRSAASLRQPKNTAPEPLH
jgi:cytoskeletal protein CcmA (bactofilin family)